MRNNRTPSARSLTRAAILRQGQRTAVQLPTLVPGQLTTDSGEQPLPEWLDDLFTLDKREAERLLKRHPYQYAKVREAWDAMKHTMRRGDALYLWSTPRSHRPSVEAYSIVRQGKAVATLVFPAWTAIDSITILDHQPRKKYLTDQLTVDEVSYLEKGGLRNQWRAMKALMQQGDELRRFDEYHGPLAWRHGYCLVRQGKVVATIVTCIS